MRNIYLIKAFILGIFVLQTGCDDSPSTSDVVEVELIVTLNDQPLPNAEITVTPIGDNVTGNMVATGITDESGKVKVKTGAKVGVIPGKVKITVNDPPPEGDAGRGQDGDTVQQQALEQAKQLKNRPIPKKYHALVTSDLELEISKEPKSYPVKLSR
ncbi:MAG: hypothetical protein R3B84_01655 [Zavarzinella sp.]